MMRSITSFPGELLPYVLPVCWFGRRRLPISEMWSTWACIDQLICCQLTIAYVMLWGPSAGVFRNVGRNGLEVRLEHRRQRGAAVRQQKRRVEAQVREPRRGDRAAPVVGCYGTAVA